MVSIMLACPACRPDAEPAKPAFPMEWLGRFHQAGALLEMDDHAEASKLYEAMRKPSGDDPAVLANLAVCLIAKQDFQRAVEIARQAAAAAPQDPHVALTLAAALDSHAQRAEALEVLRSAARRHPTHVEVLHALAGTLANLGGEQHLQEIAQAQHTLLTQVPRNLAALLDAAGVQATLGHIPEAAALLDRALAEAPDPPARLLPFIEQLDAAVAAADGPAVSRIIKITENLMRAGDRFRMDIIALGPVGGKIPRAVPHPLHPLKGSSPEAIRAQVKFADATAQWGLAELAADPHMRGWVAGTVQDDRSVALWALFDSGPGRLYQWRDGGLVDVTASAGLQRSDPCVAACFIDINNDNRMDLLLSGATSDALYLNRGGGRFEDATADSGLGAFGPSTGALPFDYDHDGDLDVLRWDAERLVLQRNDGEGRLGPAIERPGLPTALPGIAEILARDFDDDGDIDLGIRSAASGLRLFSNERMACFKEMTATLDAELKAHPAPVLEDFNRNGLLEVLDVAQGKAWEISAGFVMKNVDSPLAAPAALARAADFDCDGRFDVLSARADGSTNLAGVTLPAGVGAWVGDVDGDGLVDVLSDRGRAFRNVTTNAGNWLSVTLQAVIEGDSRFNAFGAGSLLEIRAGEHYQKRHVSSVRTHFGLGPYTHADVLRVSWPNGNYQNLEFRASDQVNLAANQHVLEEQSLKGSCPYLYAWNGESFEFVTDVLWRSALGMSLGTGLTGHHNTADDYFKIRGDQLQPRGSYYVLQFTEELWEVAYLDYSRLFVVDHPPETDVFVDEKCTAPPYPPFEIFGVRDVRAVQSARDDRGRNVTDLLARRDGRRISGFDLTRYQGVVRPHDLILDLGAFEQSATVRLFLHGWLWPTDASTNVAVDQHPELAVQLPALSVVGPAGDWLPADVVVGFPSGKNKTLVLDLSGRFPTSDHRVKLSTNMAIFWDHVFLTVGPQDVEQRVTELPVHSADIHMRGISRAFPREPHGPTIPDYAALDPAAHWRDMVGHYTRFGAVTELVRAVDNRYAIVGPGDEVTLRFDADAVPPLPPGWRRDFIIHTDGWLKDGDLNTAAGQTVEPLPFHGMTAYPYPTEEAYPGDAEHREFRREYNTRFRDTSRFRGALQSGD